MELDLSGLADTDFINVSLNQCFFSTRVFMEILEPFAAITRLNLCCIPRMLWTDLKQIITLPIITFSRLDEFRLVFYPEFWVHGDSAGWDDHLDDERVDLSNATGSNLRKLLILFKTLPRNERAKLHLSKFPKRSEGVNRRVGIFARKIFNTIKQAEPLLQNLIFLELRFGDQVQRQYSPPGEELRFNFPRLIKLNLRMPESELGWPLPLNLETAARVEQLNLLQGSLPKRLIAITVCN